MTTEQQNPAPPGPAPEHARLLQAVGTWKVDCKFFMDPSGEPMVTEATEVVESCGELWTTSRFTTEFAGQPFEGRATIGYDPLNEKWVSTWIDSMTPFLFHFEGGYEGEVLTMHGRGPLMGQQAMTDYRTTEERLPDGTRRFEMFVDMPGAGEVKIASYLYTRQS